ncbi:MAG: thiamine pyrophosphate-binding protein [Rhodobacteraceae bacterium]|nr:thiamine pyrophosphate-binding protein [Paracoccaceae bacterium]
MSKPGSAPAPAANMRHGGRILADQLRILKAELVFCVPGESFLGLLDGLHDHKDAIRTVACRHEGGAVNMAEAYGKLTGKPGLAAVTRGPGATNGSNGLHTARQDSTPMILFVGQVSREHFDREGFQEIDYRRMFGEVAKWVAQIEDAARIPEYISRAWAIAQEGRPGPVVLVLPEETLSDTADVPDIRIPAIAEAAPPPAAIARLGEMIAAAKNPVMMIGGGAWSAETAAAAAAFAEAQGLPVVTSFRRQDYMDNRHPHFCGTLGLGANPKLVDYVADECDLLINVGSRLGEIASQGYTLLGVPNARMPLVTVHPGPEEHNVVYASDLAIACRAGAFFEAAAALPARPGPVPGVARLRADYEAFCAPVPAIGAMDMGEVIAELNRALPDDAIVSNGAGNYAIWLHRFRQHRGYRTQLAPTSGSMGYGAPAAVAAALTHPDRLSVVLGGDGCFLMTAQEMATAAQYGAKVIAIVVNNGMFGTIRMHQEKHHPGRTIATDLGNPDFVKLGEAYGAAAERVSKTEDFAPALARALASETSYLIEIVVDPEALTPVKSLSAIRAEGEAARAG